MLHRRNKNKRNCRIELEYAKKYGISDKKGGYYFAINTRVKKLKLNNDKKC